MDRCREELTTVQPDVPWLQNEATRALYSLQWTVSNGGESCDSVSWILNEIVVFNMVYQNYLPIQSFWHFLGLGLRARYDTRSCCHCTCSLNVVWNKNIKHVKTVLPLGYIFLCFLNIDRNFVVVSLNRSDDKFMGIGQSRLQFAAVRYHIHR